MRDIWVVDDESSSSESGDESPGKLCPGPIVNTYDSSLESVALEPRRLTNLEVVQANVSIVDKRDTNGDHSDEQTEQTPEEKNTTRIETGNYSAGHIVEDPQHDSRRNVTPAGNLISETIEDKLLVSTEVADTILHIMIGQHTAGEPVAELLREACDMEIETDVQALEVDVGSALSPQDSENPQSSSAKTLAHDALRKELPMSEETRTKAPEVSSHPVREPILSDLRSIAPGEIRNRLCEALDSSNMMKAWVCHKVLEGPPTPGLVIHGVGNIGFPLSEHDIQRVVQASRFQETRSSSGADGKVWVVPGHLWSTNNSSWSKFLEAGLNNLEGLGLKPKTMITMNKHSLILCGAGGLVEGNLLPDHTPNTFGTLDIALPSCHENSEESFLHDGRIQSFNLRACSEYDCSYSAWYRNVKQSSTPFRYGYRLVLRYSLESSDEAQNRTAPCLTKAITELRHIVTTWASEFTGPAVPLIAYALPTDLHDAAVSKMQEACRGTDLFVCCATAERKVTKNGDTSNHYKYQEFEEDYHDECHVLKGFITVGGEELPHCELKCELDKIILQKNAFGQTIPDVEDEDDEGHQVSRYQIDVLVVMLRNTKMSIFYMQTNSVTEDGAAYKLLRSFSECGSSPSDQSGSGCSNEQPELEMRLDILMLCNLLLSHRFLECVENNASNSKTWQIYLLKAIFKVGDEVLLDRARVMTRKHCLSPELLEPIRMRFGEEGLRNNMEAELSRRTGFYQRCDPLVKLEAFLVDKAWLLGQHKLAMDMLTLQSAADGDSLGKLACSRGAGHLLDSHILPYWRRHIGALDMSLAFLNCIAKSDSTLAHRRPALFGELLEYLLSKQRLVVENSSDCNKDLARVLVGCYKLDQLAILQRVCAKLSIEASRATPGTLKAIFLPFLAVLTTRMEGGPIIQCEHIKELYQDVLNLLVIRCTPAAPVFAGWSLPEYICHCKHCFQINQFLRHPDYAIYVQDMPCISNMKHVDRALKWHKQQRLVRIVTGNSPKFNIHITKLTKDYDEAAKKWQKDIADLQKLFKTAADEPSLRSLLEEHYDKILSLQPIVRPIIKRASRHVVDLTMEPESPEPNRVSATHESLRRLVKRHRWE